ncbi:MAG: hypothetical protein U5K38_16705 [Woeseiaceae bacterium]|nr:hypothetical protein [Woeseiaceae bacterium]
MGLPEAGQIAKIEIHPTNPDIAYVAAQGQIWAPNEERGVYRTTDGGETWQHVLKVNPDTGATDLAMDPTNPRILYAGMWHHGRKPWFIKSGGEGGGIYKSTDSGDTWEKLDGGLPGLDRQGRHRRVGEPAVKSLRDHRGGAGEGRPVAQRRLRRDVGTDQRPPCTALARVVLHSPRCRPERR